MITRIKLDGVASYKKDTCLETDKKVNLIYGLNGTGKSTLSNYLYDKEQLGYSSCSVDGLNGESILVYNQKFIEEYFYESNDINGIFTLSKENKGAEEKIRNYQKEIELIKIKKAAESENRQTIKDGLENEKREIEAQIWKIKTKFTGGDRVFEFCLEGLKGNKEKLLEHITQIERLSEKPNESIEELKKSVEALQGANAQRYSNIPTLTFQGNHIENNEVFQKEIIGNENSVIAELIKQFENSDWVKKGLEFLPDEINDSGEPCPFCQEKTITNTVVHNIRSYFDESYENDLNDITQMLSDYENLINKLPSKSDYDSCHFIKENYSDFENKYNSVINVLDENKGKINEKLKTPSRSIYVTESSDAIECLNQYISSINERIQEHNKRIENKEESLRQIKDNFWNIMRWDYGQLINNYINSKKTNEKNIAEISDEILKIENQIRKIEGDIVEQQKNTINIEDAISSINDGLIELGLIDFCIKIHSDNFYRIARDNQESNAFQTLSEGERMVISFLYFIELCRGRKNATEVEQRKIILIDDPISSLSHVFVFNIGRLIKKEFLCSEAYEQVFILTHSLYFFYELTETNHERREKNQKLFRITKNCEGSKIDEMKYEEIQNDYHSYWQIIKDDKNPPALIANCMRNIIEYFFNFIEKKDLNNVFQKPELQANKHQAFCRYINRESHSLGQNIIDYKEFNYNSFKEALGLVFIESGYKNHYNKMMK